MHSQTPNSTKLSLEAGPERTRREQLRNRAPSFVDFVEGTSGFRLHDWQKVYVCPELAGLVDSKGARLMIHKPPQFGGSHLVSKRFPAWALGMNPLLRIVMAGYNLEHATAFTEIVRDIMHGDQYKALFPDPRVRLSKPCAAAGFSTYARGLLMDGQDSITAVGLLSGFTGKGADILIIDDPYASPDDARSEAINERVWRWWSELAKVRINDDTNVVVMFHRYHQDDFAGRLLAGGGWKYLRFPAVADANEDKSDPTGRKPGEILSPMRSRRFLEAIEDREPQLWLSQFQGRPGKPDGNFIRREWLRKVVSAEIPPVEQWVRFWDLATKEDQDADFTAGALCAVGPDQTLYVRDLTKFRAEWPDACSMIEEVTRQDSLFAREVKARYSVGVEKVAWQRSMVQDLFRRPVFGAVQLWASPPDGDKKERASGWVARAKFDKFRLMQGSWNQDFIEEALAFDGKGLVHDDQIDAVSGAYNLLWTLRGDLLEEEMRPAPGSIAFYRELAEEMRRQQEWDY